jgi:hypothetical protein
MLSLQDSGHRWNYQDIKKPRFETEDLFRADQRSYNPLGPEIQIYEKIWDGLL